MSADLRNAAELTVSPGMANVCRQAEQDGQVLFRLERRLPVHRARRLQADVLRYKRRTQQGTVLKSRPGLRKETAALQLYPVFGTTYLEDACQ